MCATLSSYSYTQFKSILFFIADSVKILAEKDKVVEDKLRKEREELDRIRKEREASGLC